MSALLTVTNLSVNVPIGRHSQTLVDGVSLDVAPGEIFCIVGESGSGKSMTAKSLMGLQPRKARVTGSARFGDVDLLEHGVAASVRGRGIGMIFQEPMTSLNPVLSIGCQMTEASIVLRGMSDHDARRRAIELLDSVGIADGKRRLRQYPHEFSGGMRQRVLIAMAMMSAPRLLIADEPTTALDVTVQAQILRLLRTLVNREDMGLILITHDMGVVAEMADRVLVMQRGRVVETAPVRTLFSAPAQAYSRALLAAVPRLDSIESATESATESASESASESAIQAAAASVAGDVIVDVQNISKTFSSGPRWFARRSGSLADTLALDAVSLSVAEGEVLALVGESGSGKSTLGRAIANLLTVDTGVVRIGGRDISTLSGAALRTARAQTQMIFQDPYSSLDPRFSIGQTIAEPMIIQGVRRKEARERAAQLLARVELSRQMLDRYPHEFSGGQRQRVAIARALASKPSVIVADEPTSALDVSIQAQVLDLLEGLKSERSLGMLFISHDLAVVQRIADRVAVMRCGRIVETGPVHRVLKAPQHAYTRLLIASAPVPDPTRRDGRLAVPVDIPPGLDGQLKDGQLKEVAPRHWVAL